MDKQDLLELDYGIANSVAALIQAMGMQAENRQREINGESPAYVKEHFDELIETHGIHHNAILSRWLR